MGPFSAPDNEWTPYPADLDRVVTKAHSMGYELDILAEGSAAGAIIESTPFLISFDASARFLSIRALWDTGHDLDSASQDLFAVADHWNRDNYFPTMYSMISSDGHAQVCADFVVDTAASISNKQLEDAISTGISTGIDAIRFVKDMTAHTLGGPLPQEGITEPAQ